MKKNNMPMHTPNGCLACKRADEDTRFGFCFDCATIEIIIHSGVDMHGKGLDGKEIRETTAMGKLKLLIQKGYIIYGTQQPK